MQVCVGVCDKQMNKLTGQERGVTLSLPLARRWKAGRCPSEVHFCTDLKEEGGPVWELLFSLLIMSFPCHRLADKLAIDELKDGWGGATKGRGTRTWRGCGGVLKNGFLHRRRQQHKIHYIPKQWWREKRTVAFSAWTMSTAARWMEVSISSAGTN